MSSANPAGKTMSSRLLTMKFMQRAAASPSSPASTPNERASKRQRLSAGPSRRDNDDMQAVQAALAAEDAKRQEALERQAAEAGETKWVLNLPGGEVTPSGFRVVNAGYSVIDAGGSNVREAEDEGEDERPSMPGRKSYGNFGKQEKLEDGAADYDESDDGSGFTSSSEDDEEEEDPRRRKIPSEAAEALRAKRAARKQHERADAAMMAERRRNKEVKLNRLSGISSGGSGISGGAAATRGTAGSSDIRCFNCGGPHRKNACPRLRSSRR